MGERLGAGGQLVDEGGRRRGLGGLGNYGEACWDEAEEWLRHDGSGGRDEWI